MPIYEYVCNTCGKEFEVLQKFSDRPLTRCTCSDKGRVARKLSAPSFHLQGGGWYNEGYSGKKDGNGKAETKPEAKADAKAETKSGAAESSGAAKAESSGSKSESSGSKKEASSTKKEPKKSSAPTASA
jgi:putative FmdB family regulatory protein